MVNKVIVKIYNLKTGQIVELNGEEIKSKYHPYLKLSIHKSISPNSKYTITDLMTGLSVGQGKTRLEAIEHMESRFKNISPKEIIKMLRYMYFHRSKELQLVNPTVIDYITSLDILYG